MFEEEREYFEKVVERYFEETFSSNEYECNIEWSHDDADESFEFNVAVESLYHHLGNCYSRGCFRDYESTYRQMANEVKKKCVGLAKCCKVDILLCTEKFEDLGYEAIMVIYITIYGIKRF